MTYKTLREYMAENCDATGFAIEAFDDYMKDKIVLDIEEVRAAKKRIDKLDDYLEWSCFLGYSRKFCSRFRNPLCRLCKKLTEFAKGGEDE